jgi:hypothetical protein
MRLAHLSFRKPLISFRTVGRNALDEAWKEGKEEAIFANFRVGKPAVFIIIQVAKGLIQSTFITRITVEESNGRANVCTQISRLGY